MKKNKLIKWIEQNKSLTNHIDFYYTLRHLEYCIKDLNYGKFD